MRLRTHSTVIWGKAAYRKFIDELPYYIAEGTQDVMDEQVAFATLNGVKDPNYVGINEELEKKRLLKQQQVDEDEKLRYEMGQTEYEQIKAKKHADDEDALEAMHALVQDETCGGHTIM